MQESTEKTSLKQLIQGMTDNDIQVLQGIVKSINPIKIQIINDEKLIIGPNITYVPKHLTDYDMQITIDCETEIESGGSGEEAYASHSHAITGSKNIRVNNSLKVDEKVHILSFNHGKQYYVLDRVI